MDEITEKIGGKWILDRSDNFEAALQAMDTIRDRLVGVWVLDRSENFEEAMEAMGLNILVRKIASHTKPSMEIQVQENKVVIIAKAAFFTQTLTFPLNEAYDQEYEGIKMKVGRQHIILIREATPIEPDKHKPQKFHKERVNDEYCFSKWEDNKLITEATPIEPDKHKPQKFHRERVNDELVQTMWIGDVKCVRVFKKET